MSEIEKISIKLFRLVIDIFVLSYKIIRQISLPNRKRKGNLLSSLFVFFIGIIERLNIFEHGFFSMAVLFRKKYIKHGIFILGVILFLLSLFEWTGEERISSQIETTAKEQPSTSGLYETVIARYGKEVTDHYKIFPYKTHLAFTAAFNSAFPFSFTKNRFLLIRCLRI
ncbi:MAG: hypothetical protein M3015_10590 [Bacteroidota bacterium]|nr:hypothetical protein [Bacteroidota bacterium]